MTKKIPWWDPRIGDREYDLIKDVLDRHFPNEGKITTQFEQEVCKLLNVKHAFAVPNATSAMFLGLKAYNVGVGDEVLVPNMTFIATANAVSMSGATPILVDVNKDTATVSIEAIEQAITDKTKAIIPVHVTGRGAAMDEIMEIAEKHNLIVVEDAAEAFLSKQNGKCLGTIGNAGCFSFSPHKTITTGQGGMIVTNDDSIQKSLAELKDQGRPERGTGGDDIHYSIGYNFKFTDLQAAVGVGQLHYLQERVTRMRKIYEIYNEQLKGVDGINVMGFTDEEVPQWTDVLVDDRAKLDAHLQKSNMDSRRFWYPLNTQVPYKEDRSFPGSEHVSDHALWLPSAYTLSDEDVLSVCENISKFLKGN